jgi:integrase
MAAPLVKTRHPGIYKRGSRYAVLYRVNGKQRQESARTLDEALRLKRSRESARDRGEFELIEEGRMKFRAFADEWIERYRGNGRRGFTDDTRIDYKRDLERYAYPFLNEKLGRSVAAISPRDIANWIAWLCDEQAQGEHTERVRREKQAEHKGIPVSAVKPKPVKPVALADATIRRIVSPARACLATAKREGLIRSSPCDGAVLPHRPKVNESEEVTRAITRDQLAMFLRIVHSDWQLLFEFLAGTGMRWGEVAAVRWGDLKLDGSRPNVHVRRALARRRKGQPVTFKPPKSKYGVRRIPLDRKLVSKLVAPL